MFRRITGTPENAAALERVEATVRARFLLAEGWLVLVSEEVSGVPGLPPRDTVVRFWNGSGQRYRLRIFKPPGAVTETDLPARWLLSALKDSGEAECC